jgi:hypothetical protein
MLSSPAEQALLAWYVAIGADEAIEPMPHDRLAEPPPKPVVPARAPGAHSTVARSPVVRAPGARSPTESPVPRQNDRPAAPAV